MGRISRKHCEHTPQELIELARTAEMLVAKLGDIDEATIESDGSVTLRREIYHRKPNGAEWFRLLMKDRLNKLMVPCVILTSGECWRPFKEAAKLQHRSHWYVQLVIDPTYTVDRMAST
jgi:hypothetical protein